MNKFQKIILILLVSISILPKLYKINIGIADRHSHRQADTASVTKNLLNGSGKFFIPTYHDLSDVQSGQENPKGYRMVELPIYNQLTVIFHNLVQNFYPTATVAFSSRATSIIISTISILLIFGLSYQYTNLFLPSILVTLIFAFLPFNIYYSSSVLPEPLAVMFMLLSLFLFRKKMFLSAISLSLSILIKPYTAPLTLPFLVIFGLDKLKKQGTKVIFKSFIFALISIVPFIIWRFWIKNYPQGIPASTWLFNGNGIRLKPAWFRWLFFERISNMILGSYLLIPFFLGFTYRKNRAQKLVFSLFSGVILYFLVIATGNVQHDYYQTLIIPSLSISVGFGLFYILNYTFKNNFIATFAIIILVGFGLSFSWYQVKDFYNINNPVIFKAGGWVDKNLETNAKVIAPYTGDTAFLYQTNRSGWPTEIYKFENIIKDTTDPIYLVSVNFDTYTNSMIQKFPTIYKSDKFIVLKIK